MKPWHGCRLSIGARGTGEPSGAMHERYTDEVVGWGELVPAALAAALCDIQAQPFAGAAKGQLAIPE